MVLLHALQALAPKHRWQISVAHFNHHLRGGASDADEHLVRQTAAKLRLKCFAGGADVNNLAARSKLSVEMAARKSRHEFLARTAREQKIPAIALAHHADDQVELFFLRLLRGAGGAGLAGMKGRAPSPADKTLSLIRPLLDFSKAELLAFARARKIRFRDDATNFSTDFLRNRIRHELLPLLRKKYQPAVDKTVLRLMDIVGAEADFVSAAAQRFCRRRGNAAPTKSGKPQAASGKSSALPWGGGGDFENLPPAVQRQVLQQQLTALGLPPEFELIERLRGAPGKRVSVAAGLSVARAAGGTVELRETRAAAEHGFNAGNRQLSLAAGTGEAEFGGKKFRWRIQVQRQFQLPRQRAGEPPKHREFFDADQIGGAIVLRHWRPGDRFQPIGMKSAVKLQDLFVNAKIPAARRRELVLAATAGGEVFWVEGLRLGEKFKLTPQTRRQLVWRVAP